MKLFVSAFATAAALASTFVNAGPTLFVLGDSLSEVGLLSAADAKGANGLWRKALGISDADYIAPELFWQGSFTSAPGPWTAQVNGTTIGDGVDTPVTVKSLAYGGARLLETFDSTDLCGLAGMPIGANCTVSIAGLQSQADMLVSKFKNEINVGEDMVVFEFGINDIIALLVLGDLPAPSNENSTALDAIALDLGNRITTQLTTTRTFLQTELPGLRVVIADIPTLNMPFFKQFGAAAPSVPTIAASINIAMKRAFPNKAEIWSFNTALSTSMNKRLADRQGTLITDMGCATGACFSIACEVTCLSADNAEDYYYVDLVHPTASAHTYVKDHFTNFLNVNGLLMKDGSKGGGGGGGDDDGLGLGLGLGLTGAIAAGAAGLFLYKRKDSVDAWNLGNLKTSAASVKSRVSSKVSSLSSRAERAMSGRKEKALSGRQEASVSINL